MREIKESDWKTLRQLHSVALDRYCERVLTEIDRLRADSSKSFHQRYLDVFKILRDKDKEIARIFNDLRRSTALYQLAAMKDEDLLSEEEFLSLSEETRGLVGILLKN